VTIVTVTSILQYVIIILYVWSQENWFKCKLYGGYLY